MSTTYGPGLTPLRWCCICLAHYVLEATSYLCVCCEDPGLKPGRGTVLATPGSVSAAWGGGM